MKLLALAACFAMILPAQTTFEIRGTVSEPGLGGIAGAKVRAVLPAPSETRPEFNAFTDGRGQFVVRTARPGTYDIIALFDGYAPAGFEGRASARVDLDHPRADVQIRLVRTGVLMGRLLDAETREPIEGIQVFAMQRQSDSLGTRWGQAFTYSGIEVTPENRAKLAQQFEDERRTKEDGTFKTSGIIPGEMAATLNPMPPSPWTSGFSPDDLKVIDKEYEPLFWPGGVSRDDVRPLTLGSGSVLSFGDMLLTKTPHYRAHVSIAQGTCPMGESMRITLFNGVSPAAPQVAPCGSEWTLRHLRPGSYVLYAVSDWQAFRDNIENAAWATARFEITDENVEVILNPQPGVILDGQLVAAEGVTTMPDQFPLGAQPELAADMRPGLEEFVEWLPDRKFRMMVSPRPFRLEVLQGRTPYAKQLRYNGSPLADLKVPLNSGSSAHHLDIVLDDKLGSLMGTVTGGEPLGMLALWKEGSTRPETIPVENSTIRSTTLIPGEYRAILVRREGNVWITPSEAVAKIDGEKVTVRPGETITINIRATQSSR